MMHEQDWPVLDYSAWKDSAATLQLWMQMAGKVRVAHEPWLNHGWHVPLYLTARGVGTSLIHTDQGALDIEFDLSGHSLLIRSAAGEDTSFPLEPMNVADFHGRFTGALKRVGIDPHFSAIPNEVANPIRFASDHKHRSYDRDAVHRYWRALLQIDRTFKLFRTGFVGKASPVHLFWGSLDLAVTRFSGRPAPPHPGGIPGLPDAITREAYDHELSSAGFWPGDERYPHPAFYSYAYPQPDGFASADVRPAQAFYSKDFGEWLLPYEAVRLSEAPQKSLLVFLESTYRAASACAHWDRGLEARLGKVGVPRGAKL